jgi:hypothetical protein
LKIYNQNSILNNKIQKIKNSKTSNGESLEDYQQSLVRF